MRCAARRCAAGHGGAIARRAKLAIVRRQGVALRRIVWRAVARLTAIAASRPAVSIARCAARGTIPTGGARPACCAVCSSVTLHCVSRPRGVAHHASGQSRRTAGSSHDAGVGAVGCQCRSGRPNSIAAWTVHAAGAGKGATAARAWRSGAWPAADRAARCATESGIAGKTTARVRIVAEAQPAVASEAASVGGPNSAGWPISASE